VANPPGLPLSQQDMDRIYGLPYTRRPHPMYKGEKIPAFETVKDSVTIMRGCFGGCTFCSITAHQGRIIQSRSQESVLTELRALGQGRVVQRRGLRHRRADGQHVPDALHAAGGRGRLQAAVVRAPEDLQAPGDRPRPLVQLMKESREVPGIRKVLVASGVRMDLAQRSPEYMQELAAHHVGGHLKVAPEHTDPDVLRRMRKPDIDDYGGFADAFKEASARRARRSSSSPISSRRTRAATWTPMIDLALFLKRNGYRPDQVQDFIPAPFDVATCMYYTGIDPFTGEEVYTAKHLRDRKLQRALLQFFKPENYFEVREALLKAGRSDLIGSGCDALIPANPPKAALRARMERTNREVGEGRYVHTIASPAESTAPRPSAGYRPKRKTAAPAPHAEPAVNRPYRRAETGTSAQPGGQRPIPRPRVCKALDRVSPPGLRPDLGQGGIPFVNAPVDPSRILRGFRRPGGDDPRAAQGPVGGASGSGWIPAGRPAAAPTCGGRPAGRGPPAGPWTCGGRSFQQADLTGALCSQVAELGGTDFYEADLRDAILRDANPPGRRPLRGQGTAGRPARRRRPGRRQAAGQPPGFRGAWPSSPRSPRAPRTCSPPSSWSVRTPG
jgi:hypothetical protein